MVPASCVSTDAVLPPAYQRALAKQPAAVRLTAVAVVLGLALLPLCQAAVAQGQRRCPPPLRATNRGVKPIYSEASLLLIALLRTLWRLSYQDMYDWLVAWPGLARACGLPVNSQGHPRVPSPSQQWKRGARAGAPPCEALFVLLVREALRRRLVRLRDVIIDSAPVLAWRRADPDAQVGHAPAQHPTRFLRGFRVHTLLCRGSGLPLLFLLAPANAHDAPFARPLLAGAVHLYQRRPRIVRLDAAYWGLTLIAWIHTTLGAVAVIPWNPKRQKNRTCLPPTWTHDALGKRSAIERFFGRVFLFFHLQRPPLCGWSAVASRVALTYAATLVVALAAQQAGRPDLIRSPKRVLAHLWEA
ncbi:MAG: transposase [Chloroflexota bacterium]